MVTVFSRATCTVESQVFILDDVESVSERVACEELLARRPLFTVSLVVITYLVIFFFVFYDLFPYGVKVAESFRFWMEARRSRSGKTAAEAEASYRARQRWKRARALLLRRVRGNARLVFRKELATRLTKVGEGGRSGRVFFSFFTTSRERSRPPSASFF